MIDARVAIRVDVVSIEIFRRKRKTLRLYLAFWAKEKNDWKNANDVEKRSVKVDEEIQFLLKNIADSLRRFINREFLNIFELFLNFDD